MTTEYERTFKRPLPEGYMEAPCCLNCGLDGITCPCVATATKPNQRKEGLRLKHMDGTPLTTEEKVKLYRPPFGTVKRANPVVAAIIRAGQAGTEVFHGTRAMDDVSAVERAVAKREMRQRKRLGL